MRSILTASLILALAACGGGTPEKAKQIPPEQREHIVADLGGGPAGPVYTRSPEDMIALSGMDALSYFEGDAPVEGKPAYTVKYQGFDYRFADEAHATAFAAEPGKYAPAYGGYGAWAMANGRLAPPDPALFRIVNGRLYLFFTQVALDQWEKDSAWLIAEADKAYAAFDPGARFDDPER